MEKAATRDLLSGQKQIWLITLNISVDEYV